MILQNAPKK